MLCNINVTFNQANYSRKQQSHLGREEVMHMVYNRELSQRLFFTAVAILSILGNLFFVALIVRNKKLMKGVYHVILLSLACADMLTGVFLLITPVYIIGHQRTFAGENIGSAIFCYVIANQFLVFTFGIVSLYTVTLLAAERWFAVFRPLVYRTIFRHKRVRKYLIAIWLSSFAANSTHIIETKYLFHGESGSQRCVFSGVAGEDARVVIGVLEISIKFIAPVIIMLVTFTQLYQFMIDASGLTTTRRSQVVITRVTRMAATTSLIMVLCWFPNQLFYFLFKLNVVELNTMWHRATVILCMLNSCLNPCIFLLSNKFYRTKAKELFSSCSRLVKKEARDLPPRAVVCVKFNKTDSEEARVEIQSKLSTAILGTEGCGRCREVVVIGR